MDNESKYESVYLSASARLISQLGEQLISDELVALIELIKNSYDADATQVRVDVDTNIVTEYGIGKITIEDNGNGMLMSIIKNGFLRLSTNFKNEFRVSPHFKRAVLGNKGLGRLSFQRLGRFVKVVTTPRVDRLEKFIEKSDIEYLEHYNEFEVFLDWGNLSLDIDLTGIEAKVDSLYVDKPVYGTKIELFGIKNQNFWNFSKKDEKRVKNEIFGMVNPFVKKNNSKFQIYLSINDKPFTNDKIDEDIIDKISDIKVKFSFKDWIMTINIDKKQRYINREIENAIGRLRNSKFKLEKRNLLENSNVTYTMDFNKLDEVRTIYPFLKYLRFDMDSKGLAYPGDFSGVIYATEFSRESQGELTKLVQAKELSEDIKTYSELKTIWESANGIFMFRNDFRILPYGKKDWMGFTKKSQTYKNNIYKEHTIAGYIDIDGETSENLVEQTNRQGIVEDEYGNNFLKLFHQVLLEVVVRDDVRFREGFEVSRTNKDEEYIITKNNVLIFKRIIIDEEKKDKIIDDVEKTVSSASTKAKLSPEEELRNVLMKFFGSENEVEKILKSSDETITLMLKAITNSLEKGNEIHEFVNSLRNKINELKKVEEKIKHKNKQESYLRKKEIEELYGLLPIVGQGIIIEALTHELNRIDENIKAYAVKTKDALSKRSDYNLNDLIRNQQLIIDETSYLREQLNHLEPTYRKNSKIYESVDMMQFIKETYISDGPMSKKAASKDVKIVISGSSFIVDANRGYLITIFDNLFLNSLYWIEDSRDKSINYEIRENGEVIIWDSGPGIHTDIEDELFEPFKSMKKEGRGLGLFIVKELLNQMNADINLIEERKNNRLYKFHITFNNIQEV